MENNVVQIKAKAERNLRSKGISTKNKEAITAFIFLAPWLIGLIAFTLWPFINSFVMSFQRTNIFVSEFVGLDNFREMMDDHRFIKSLTVTMRYVFLSVPLRLAFALFIAMLLKDRIAGLNGYRTIVYIPSLIGGSVAVAAMWTQLFGARGVINDVLGIFGIEGRSWVANPDTALWVLILLAIWQFGSPMVIFLSGLKNIPASYYEACKVDGGSKLNMFFKITLPMLSPIILFNIVLQTIGTFQVFTQGYLITGGGPMNETLFMVLYIYNKAFTGAQMGYASAMSWVLLAVIGIVSGLLFLSSKYWVYYENK